jgi:hypothetical protein
MLFKEIIAVYTKLYTTHKYEIQAAARLNVI